MKIIKINIVGDVITIGRHWNLTLIKYPTLAQASLGCLVQVLIRIDCDIVPRILNLLISLIYLLAASPFSTESGCICYHPLLHLLSLFVLQRCQGAFEFGLEAFLDVFVVLIMTTVYLIKSLSRFTNIFYAFITNVILLCTLRCRWFNQFLRRLGLNCFAHIR